MSVTGELWRYSSERLVQCLEPLSERLTVADSFLVHNGTAHSLDAHFSRFEAAIGSDEVTLSQLPGFYRAALESIPTEGDWFPRFEYRSDADIGDRLAFQLRPAPELTETLTLWTSLEPDSRISPKIKGPDLALGMQLRRAANLHGADEAVFLDQHGYIADGALSSIMWWRDGKLFGPDTSTNWLPSITREEAFQLALQAGYEIGEERSRPEDLEGCEVWSVSSLQGIRGVTKWGDIPIEQPKLYQTFRKRMSLTFAPITKDS